VAGDSRVLRIGLIQALSEGGMYTVSSYENVSVSILISQTRLVASSGGSLSDYIALHPPLLQIRLRNN
jgi:hypothetical protein